MHISYKLKYTTIISILILGYFFLYKFSGSIGEHTVCIIKNVTGVSCPACGSTRATVELMQGNLVNAAIINPLGIITNILITISFFWMIIDIIRNKETFLPFLKMDWDKRIKIFIVLIVVANWTWNIVKGI